MVELVKQLFSCLRESLTFYRTEITSYTRTKNEELQVLFQTKMVLVTTVSFR